ncbi:MAG: type II secretion system protein [Phycisphaerales bacterium]|nr:prepilin-type N-terminal cleavage/methylation domain-containing protein [bacterium]
MKFKRTDCATERSGFTLVELLVVMAIIAILVAIALPAFSRVRTQARISTTQTLMSSLNAGVAQYQTDRRRLPGLFGAEDIGSDDNFTGGWKNRPGITALENALIDLAGGGFSSEQELQNAGFEVGDAIEVELNDRIVYIIPALVGSVSETAYVDLGGDSLVALEGQNSNLEGNGIPDVLDAFGTPIMMWAQNEQAGRNASYVLDNTRANEKALFYWASNGSYAMSAFPRGSFNSLSNPPQGVAQYRRSLLSSFLIPGERERSLSIMALTGNRAFPTTSSSIANPGGIGGGTEVLVPAQPRGETIFVSAGPDKIYLNGFPSNATTPDFTTAIYTPTGDFDANQVDSDGKPIELFDEVILGGG